MAEEEDQLQGRFDDWEFQEIHPIVCNIYDPLITLDNDNGLELLDRLIDLHRMIKFQASRLEGWSHFRGYVDMLRDESKTEPNLELRNYIRDTYNSVYKERHLWFIQCRNTLVGIVARICTYHAIEVRFYRKVKKVAILTKELLDRILKVLNRASLIAQHTTHNSHQ